jgi:hypothetical protein
MSINELICLVVMTNALERWANHNHENVAVNMGNVIVS